MDKLRRVIIFVLCLAITTSCEKANVLTEYSNTDSDEALYLDAKNKMDAFDWDGAVTILTTRLSATYQARSDVKTTLMHAYGGKCGISLFDLVNNLKNVSSSQMFVFALSLFANKSVDVTACDNAVATLLSIGATAAERSREQNLFAAILGLTRMAATLHTKFDTESSGLGDGLVDAGVDACAISSAAGRLSDAEVNKLASGVGLIFENLATLGEELTSGSAGSAFDSAKTLCETALPLPTIGTPQDYGAPGGVTWVSLGLPASPTWEDLGLPADFADPIDCMNTDESQVPDKMRRIFRRMISSSSMGFGSCDLTDVNLTVDANASPIATVTSACCPLLDSP